MNDPIISVKELCKTFGDFKAVDRITFDVARGEIFGFLGAMKAALEDPTVMLLDI